MPKKAQKIFLPDGDFDSDSDSDCDYEPNNLQLEVDDLFEKVDQLEGMIIETNIELNKLQSMFKQLITALANSEKGK